MICPECGGYNKEGARSCVVCGELLGEQKRGALRRFFGWLGRAFSSGRETYVVRKTTVRRTPVERTKKTYRAESLDELPPDVRKRIEAIRAEHPDAKVHMREVTVSGPTRITVTEDGVERTYTSLDEMSPELRARCEEIMKRHRHLPAETEEGEF